MLKVLNKFVQDKMEKFGKVNLKKVKKIIVSLKEHQHDGMGGLFAAGT